MTRDDNEICKDLSDLLSHDTRIDSTNLQVIVKNGRARLSGSVLSLFEKVIAQQICVRVKGVNHVENFLIVKPTLSRPDEDIADFIRWRLLRDIRIDHPEHILVSVAKGEVTLTGTVPNAITKTEISSDAWSVPGVIAVHNDLTVKPGIERTDEDIAAAVRSDLVSDPALDGKEIAVEVKAGVVFLRGTVKTTDQKQVAEQDAWMEPGVVAVLDELAVSSL